jgi:protein-tyrosine phosphatase
VFDGLLNFRDLGGRPVNGGGVVRPGVLYRSDSLAYASTADADRLVNALGVATVVDLRGDREIALRGRGPLADLSVKYIHAPIVDVSPGDGDLARHYVAMLAERGASVAALLRRLTESPALPVIVHCEAGRDRTGVVVATILGLVGVPDDVISADYELSAEPLPAMNVRWREREAAAGRPVPPNHLEETWVERAQAMARTIVAVEKRWGGWTGWAAEYKLTADEIARLRDLLVTADQP